MTDGCPLLQKLRVRCAPLNVVMAAGVLVILNVTLVRTLNSRITV